MSNPVSKPGRILHVLFSAGLGGCESLCVDLVRYLDKDKWDSEVVFLSNENGPTRERLEALGVPVHTCTYNRTGRTGFIRRFARLCRERDIDRLISHSFGVHLFVGVGARLGGVRRVLVSVQNPPPSDEILRRKTTVLAQLSRPFVSREIACSYYVSNLIVKKYRLPSKRISVVWNWCDIDVIAKRAMANCHVDKPDEPILGMVARLDPIKDHTTLLGAFARFRDKYPKARLRLIGDGPSRPELERLADELGITESIEFLGARQDIPEQMSRFDIFVYATTENEGFGIVLAEAMAAGVPIVATDIGPCSEVLDGGRAGLLVSPKNAASLAEGIERLWMDKGLRAELTSTAICVARERYSIQAAMRKIEELLHI